MITSDKIDMIAGALSKAQGVMETTRETSTNPLYHSRYADLAEVWATGRKPLTENGLSVIQAIATEKQTFVLKTPTKENPEKESNCLWLTVTTRLVHTSEQWFEDSVSLPVEADPQSLGKVTTYVRRYALMAMVGIAPEDDDGNEASGKQGTKQQAERNPAPPPAQSSTPAEHYCVEHQTKWFKTAKMQSYAHPIGDTKEWCFESASKPGTRHIEQVQPAASKSSAAPTGTPSPSKEEKTGTKTVEEQRGTDEFAQLIAYAAPVSLVDLDWLAEQLKLLPGWTTAQVLAIMGNKYGAKYREYKTINEAVSQLDATNAADFTAKVQEAVNQAAQKRVKK